MPPDEIDDRRSDIAAVMEKASAPEPIAPIADTSPAPGTDLPPGDAEPKAVPTPEGDARPRDASGKFVKAEGEKPPVTPTPGVPAQKLAPQVQENKPIATEPKKFRAPSNWRPLAKEKWEGLPPEVQEESIRIDREVKMALQDASEARQFAQKWREMSTPYEPMFRGAGTDSLGAANYLFQQYAALTQAPPQVRAQTIATWINQYLPGQEGIELISQVLANGPQPTQNARQQSYVRDPRVDELYSRIAQAEQQQRANFEREAEEAIANIENEEFFDTVRPIMADLIEVAGRNGLRLSMEDAYNRAVLMHPETAKVLEQRKAYQNATASTAKSEAAAVSVRSNPAAGDSMAQPRESMRDDLSAAWDAARRG